mmetsp:Transcript_14180/g.30778  ORF Transcript_14180/g.30778 Transcript_14180/m.30778 type:complete len:270 (+) Transcript_14180:42-851(+)
MADEEDKKEAPAPDSDEEDKDYVPPADGESDNEGGGSGVGVHGKSHDDDAGRPRLPAQKQKAVDEAFASLFGPPPAAAASSTSTSTSTTKKGKKKDAKSKKAMKKKKNLLASMFGKSAAEKLMSTSSAIIMSDTNSRKRDRPLQGLEKKTVTETKVFAGKAIEVKRTVVEPTAVAAAASTAAAAPPTSSGGIDSVLANLGGPQKMSTVAKTSSDWDTFKNKTGLDEELEEKAKGKDAYLVKKDFLDRVDQRTFEVEKAERDRKRAAAGR